MKFFDGRRSFVKMLIVGFIIFAGVFGLGYNNHVFADGNYQIPFSGGTSLGTVSQTGDYLVFNSHWVQNKESQLSNTLIIDRFAFDIAKACRGNESGYSVDYNPNVFGCWSSNEYKIDWEAAESNHYYSIGARCSATPQSIHDNSIILTFNRAARRASDGSYVPVTITISNIIVGKADPCSAALLVGFEWNDWVRGTGWYGETDKNKSGLFNFSSFRYAGGGSMPGVTYDVDVKFGNGSERFRLPWLFSDIDQADHTAGDITYGQGGIYAEHVKLKESDGRLIHGYNAHAKTKLKVASDGAVYADPPDSKKADVDLLVLIEASGGRLKFEWGGSGCSTEIIDAPSFLFENSTTIKYGDKAVKNNDTFRNVSELVVHGETHSSVTFDHRVSRVENIGLAVSKAATGYRIKERINSDSIRTISNATTNQLSSGGGQTFTKTVTGKIEPDRSKVIQQSIEYQRTNMNSAYVWKPNNNVSCALAGGFSGGQCIELYRPPANFTGKITAVAEKKDSNGRTLQREEKNTDTNNGGEIKIELPIDSGKYSVKFTQSVTRKDLSTYGSARGTMKAEIKSYTKRTDNFRKEDNTTIDLTEGQTQQTFKDNDTKNVRTLGYSSDEQYGGISGELYYGESVKYCSHLETVSWLSKRNPVDHDNKNICVTISRPSKPCSEKVIKTGAETRVQPFGVYSGRNYGAIGVTNLTNKQSESTKITSADGNIEGVLGNVFAKPGDSIQFEYNMCAGAFYTAQANDLGKRNDVNFGSRYGAEGQLEHGALKDTAGIFKTNGSDGYLFKNTLPMVDSIYSNPAKYVTIGGGSDGRADWRWSDGQKAESPMKSGKFMTNTTAHPWFASAEDTETSPDINDTTYECTHEKNDNDNTSAKKEANAYQVSGKQSTNSGSSKCHTSIGNIFDVGGTISQSLYWNNLFISVTGVNKTAKASGAYQNSVATAYVKVPYNYILKPFVENNNNGEDVNTKVVYLGETYKMTPGVVTAPRKNYRVTYNDTEYATITKETHVKLETYYIHDGKKYEAGGDDANTHDEDIIMRFNKDGYLGNASDVVKTIEFKILDSDTGNAPSVGDKICTDITVWPADSHDHPDADYSEAEINKRGGKYENAGGERGIAKPLNNPYLNIALREDSVDGAINSRTTTSCSMVAKRPTMSVESGNVYSKSGYDMSRYSKNIDTGDYIFSSWSEYGVFGKINKVDEHLISGAAVGYNRSSSYYGLNSEGQKKNKTRPNSGDVSTGSNLSSKTCIFETQTFANANCENKNAKTDEYGDPKNADIGGQSVTDYKQKILDRYRVDDKYKNVNCSSGSVQYGGESYCKVQDLGSGNGLKDYTKNNGSSAIVVKAKDDIYIGGGSPGSIPGAIPKYFTDETVGEGEDNQIDYNRTLVYDASGQSIVIDGDISYNSVGSKLDDIVGVVIIAKNVYFTDVPSHIDAVIIAENEVNTCKYAEGVEMKIGEGATLNSDVCNKELIFEAPVITNKLVLNRTYGAENGVESIQRAEIFDLNMANYLWSFNQMSRYSQAVTTYSRELPSRY